MQKQFWTLLGLVAFVLIVFSGHNPGHREPNTKLAADLRGVTLAPAPATSTAVTTTTLDASSSSLEFGTTTTDSGLTASTSTAPVCSVDLSGITNAITAAISAAIGGTPAATATTTTTGATTTPSVYQYKYLTSVDECTLNKYGAQGWSISQIGLIITDNNGGPYYAADCKTPVRGFADWAFFVKPPLQ